MTECTFCDITGGTHPAHTVYADDSFVAFLDFRPVFKGHLLVVPKQHYVTLADLPAPMVGPLFAVVQRISALLPDALGAQGTFIGMNNIVSQSVPHLHAHVIPRTKGDGLRGFFWPRVRYASDAEAARYAGQISAALEAHPGWSPPER